MKLLVPPSFPPLSFVPVPPFFWAPSFESFPPRLGVRRPFFFWKKRRWLPPFSFLAFSSHQLSCSRYGRLDFVIGRRFSSAIPPGIGTNKASSLHAAVCTLTVVKTFFPPFFSMAPRLVACSPLPFPPQFFARLISVFFFVCSPLCRFFSFRFRPVFPASSPFPSPPSSKEKFPFPLCNGKLRIFFIPAPLQSSFRFCPSFQSPSLSLKAEVPIF